MNDNLKIGIVGLGLIGGSIFKALFSKGFDVCAVSKSPATIDRAKEFSPNVFGNLSSLSACNLVFVCTPMNKTPEILDELENIVSADAIVMDVCSLKRFLQYKKRPYKFIPSHPMAGSELSGFDNSFETLFENAKWVLTPLEGIAESDIKIISEIIGQLGAKIILSTPQDHDEAVALISHMPMLVAQALFKTASGNELAMKLASSGFRDMTRLALSNTEMAQDMINLNSDSIQSAVLKLYSSIGELLGENYKSEIENIKKCRQEMYSDGKNIL